MKIVIVINTKQYPSHAQRAALLQTELSEREGYVVTLIDMGTNIPLHEKTYAISNESAKLIITLDMAGFELRNTMESASYNVMHCRMAHLLFGQYKEYEKWLDEIMNFSMFFFAEEKLCKQIQQKHSHIDNIRCVEYLTQLEDESACESVVELILQETEVEADC